MIKKEDGLVNWAKSAHVIYNQWRAYIKWPGVYTFSKDKRGMRNRLKLVEIECLGGQSDQPLGTLTAKDKGIFVACSRGIIKLIKLQPEGKKTMTAKEFLNGHREIIGQKLS